MAEQTWAKLHTSYMPRSRRIILPVSFFVLTWSHFSNSILLPVLCSPGKYGLKSRISETSHVFPYRSQIPDYDFTVGWSQPRYRCRATGSGRCSSHPQSQRIAWLLSEWRINVSAVIQTGAAYWSTSAPLSLVIMEMREWPFPEVSEHKGDCLIAFGGYRGCPTAGLEDFLSRDHKHCLTFTPPPLRYTRVKSTATYQQYGYGCKSQFSTHNWSVWM